MALPIGQVLLIMVLTLKTRLFSLASNSAFVNNYVTPVTNNAPVLDLDANNSSTATGANYQTTFTENGAAVSIGDVDTSVTDPDNANITSATHHPD